MGFQKKLLVFLITLPMLFSFSTVEAAAKKKKAPAKKTEGYYLAVRYFASEHKQLPKNNKKTNKKKKTNKNQKKNKSKRS